MALKLQLSCDECGTLKQETNHWLCVRQLSEFEGKGLQIRFLAGIVQEKIGHWQHCCGADCALKIISKYLSRETNEITVDRKS